MDSPCTFEKVTRISFGMLLTVLFCLFPFSVEAKSNTTDQIVGMSLEDLLNIQISVASKTEQTAEDSPSSVTVINREEMKNLGVSSVEEVLNYVPGFVVYRNAKPYLKEYISPRGGRWTDVLFLYNGQPLNCNYKNAYSNGTQYIPIENIKQIEVIRGPGSALYGSNAFLGVVNIVTVDDVNEVYVAAGDIDRREAAVNVSSTVGDFTVAAFVKSFSDSGYGYGTVTDSWGQKEITHDPTKGFDTSVTLKYKNFTMNARHNEVHIEDFIMFGNMRDGVNDGKVAQNHVHLKYFHQMNDRLEFDISGGVMDDYWYAHFLQIPVGKVPIDDEDGNRTTNDKWLAGGPVYHGYGTNLNIDTRYKISDANQLMVGASFEFQKDTRTDNMANWNYKFPAGFEYYGYITYPSRFNIEEHRTILGLYVQDQYKFLDSLNLTAGVRYDHYNDFGDSINPRAALVYTTPFQSKVKLMYGTAFRAPNRSELYDINNRQWAGNKDLDAENVTTIEAAYIQNLKFLQGSVTYFNSKVTDMVTAGERVEPDNPNSPLYYDNLGEMKTQGIELELKLIPTKNIYLSSTFLKFIDADSDELYVPENTGSLAINYQTSRFSWNISGLYRESMKHVKNQDDYFIFNTALYVNIFENLRLKAVIKNLADEKYHTYTNVFEEGVINRGRTFTIGIESPI